MRIRNPGDRDQILANYRHFSEFTFKRFAKPLFLLIFVLQQLSRLSACSEKKKPLTGRNHVDIVVKSGKKWDSGRWF
jgi:hypothetical protein